MLTRRNIALGLVALLLATLQLSQVFLSRSDGGSGQGGVLFPGFEPDAVASIELRSTEGEVHLELASGRWGVRERAGFPAEEILVESLLKRIPDLRDGDQVAAEASSHALYGLGEESVEVSLKGAASEPLLAFRVGRPVGETQGSYLLPAGQDAVYRSASLGLPQVDPARWLELHLVASFDLASVGRVELDFGDGRRLDLVRLENGRWDAVGLGKTIAPAQLQQLMSFAINAILRDVELVDKQSVGLELPALSVSFHLDDGVRRLDLGGVLGDGRAASSPDWGGPWVAEVPHSTAESLESTAELIYRALQRD